MNKIPRVMKAAILVELNQPLVIDEIGLPDTLDCGQVLVKIHYSGICGSQLGEISGAKGEDKFLPHLLGHEGSGTVVATGPGVKRFKADDRVILHWKKGPGIESTPPVYKWKGKNVNAGFVTTFNEYAIVSENRLAPLPASGDLIIAPLFGCAVTTGFGVMENNAHVKMGESVVIIGAGGVGLNMIQAASLMSANPIIAVDQFDNRLELAKRFGATHTINSRQQDLKDSVRTLLGSGGADVVVDNTGNPEIIATAYELTQPQGRTILVGVPRKGQSISIYSFPLHFGKVLTGSHGGNIDPATDIPRYLRLQAAGRLNLHDMISATFTLDDINVALEQMRNGTVAGKCMIQL